MQATLLRGITGASSRTSANGTCSRSARHPRRAGPPRARRDDLLALGAADDAVLRILICRKPRDPHDGPPYRPVLGSTDAAAARRLDRGKQWRARAGRAQEHAWMAGSARICAAAAAAVAHPVEDFLFTYYSYRPAALRRWHPGLGVRLEGEDAAAFARSRGTSSPATAQVDPTCGRSRDQVRWIRRLLAATAGRPMAWAASASTSGRWSTASRRPRCATRLPAPTRVSGTDTVVEAHRIACTHYDAFRFFTERRGRGTLCCPPARRSTSTTSRDVCTPTMDCYKWAYKLSPHVGGAGRRLLRPGRRFGCRHARRAVRPLLAGGRPDPDRDTRRQGEYVAAQRDFAGRGRCFAPPDRRLRPDARLHLPHPLTIRPFRSPTIRSFRSNHPPRAAQPSALPA